jgi:hypothetical protein
MLHSTYVKSNKNKRKTTNAEATITTTSSTKPTKRRALPQNHHQQHLHLLSTVPMPPEGTNTGLLTPKPAAPPPPNCCNARAYLECVNHDSGAGGGVGVLLLNVVALILSLILGCLEQ